MKKNFKIHKSWSFISNIWKIIDTLVIFAVSKTKDLTEYENSTVKGS